MNKFIAWSAGIATAFLGFVSAGVASAQTFTATEVSTIIATTTDTVGTVLSSSLPAIVALVAALIGLGILLRYIKRWIGGK